MHLVSMNPITLKSGQVLRAAPSAQCVRLPPGVHIKDRNPAFTPSQTTAPPSRSLNDRSHFRHKTLVRTACPPIQSP